MNDEPGGTAGPSDGRGRISPLALSGLRLAADPAADGIAALALDAVVPAMADAAGVFAAERLFRGGSARRNDNGRTTLRRLAARFARDGRQVSPEAFPPGEVVIIAPGSPYDRCMRDGEPLIFTRPDVRTLEQAHPSARDVYSRYASFLTVPMTAGGTASGFLALARAPGGSGFADEDAAAARVLAAHTGAGIAAAVALARHRALADTLQRGLLAADPPQPAGLEVAGRCVPASGHVIGGDWYDVIALPSGRTGIVIGDVMGHGPEAAAVMAQLRAAAHALAQLDLPPAELLRQLDRTTTTLRDVPLATCVYAVIDPAGASCTLAAAGHLPAVLARPDGVTRALDLPAGRSLGLGPAEYGQARVSLSPGTVIALYTDGLVETRSRSFDQGIQALRAELADTSGPLGARCDALIGALAPLPEDDTTLVLVRVPDREPR